MYSSIKMAGKLRVITVAAIILASMTFGVMTAGADDSSNYLLKGVVYVGSEDGVYALNAATGAIIWVTNIDAVTTPVVVKGVIYFGSDDINCSGICALDAATGEVLLPPITNDAVNSSSAVVKDVIYFGTETGISAIDARMGEILWTANIGAVNLSPVVVKGVVYVNSDDGNYALDAATGAIIWGPDLLP